MFNKPVNQYLRYTICNFLKKETPVIDKKAVIAVCIDDFIIKKGQSYGTIMVDISKRQIIDMIDSRDYETLSKKKLKPQILIQATNQEDSNKETAMIKQADENRKLTLKGKCEKIEQLLSEGKYKTVICRSINMDIRAYDKLMAMTPEERESLFKTKMMTEHEEKVKQKMELVNEVRELKKIGCSNREVTRRTGLARKTIRRYLDESFNPIHAPYGKKKNVY